MSLAPTTPDRLRTMLDKDGPYLTAYFDVIDDNPATQWEKMRGAVLRRDVPRPMVQAVDARVVLPIEDDIGGWGIIVSADGSTEVFTSPDAPRRPVVRLAPIPYMAPAIEWEHRNVPHVVVLVSSSGHEIVPFIPGQNDQVIDCDLDDSVRALEGLVLEHGVQMVIVAGVERLASTTAAKLRDHLPPSVLVEMLPEESTASTDEFAASVVRAVSNMHATETVNALREFRFEKSHGNTREGMGEVLDSLADTAIRTLLVHDDPDDNRMVGMVDPADSWTIDDPSSTSDDAEAVRLVDFVVASALMHNAEVRVIPSTGRTGPKGDVAVIVEDDITI